MKAPGLMILLGKKHPGEGDDMKDDMGEDLKAMASEVLDAVESKDEEMLATALKGFVKACMMAEDKGEYEDEEE